MLAISAFPSIVALAPSEPVAVMVSPLAEKVTVPSARLRIVSADQALGRGTAIALGKNIGRRFYVEIITDGRGYSATQAEFRITSWLSILGSISTIGRESIVAKASKDY